MRFPSKGSRPALDIFWYDGGIKPAVPEELMAENKELAEEGMLFVGDKGKILGGSVPRTRRSSRGEDARLPCGEQDPEPAPPQPRAPRTEQDNRPRVSPRDAAWIEAFRAGRAVTATSCSPVRSATRSTWPRSRCASAAGGCYGFSGCEDHQRARGERVPHTRVSRGLEVVGGATPMASLSRRELM